MTLISRFIDFNLAHQLFNSGDKIVVACSGGCDSMAMAHLFHQQKIKILLAHCNFQLRGDEANGDENFVKQKATEWKIDFQSIKFDTEKFAAENKISIQQAARKLRYDWFEKLLAENDFTKIATAHHLNDNIETVFINLVRGTGIAGLTGIAAQNKKIIRPILFATRNEIENYAAENNLDFRNDSSNNSDDYLRNKIRHHLVPLMKEMNPNFENTMAQNIFNFKEANELIDVILPQKLKKIIVQKKEEWYINLKLLNHQPAAATLLYEAVKPFGFNTSQAFDIFNNKNSISGTTYFSATHRLLKHQQTWVISKINEQKKSVEYIDEQTQKVVLENGKLTIEKIEWTAENKISTNNSIALLDAKNIDFPLTLRTWKPGDYFYPLGMNTKKKKLSDFFVQQKLSLIEKEKMLLLCSGQRILWVVGMRIDERFKITNSTKKVLKIVWG